MGGKQSQEQSEKVVYVEQDIDGSSVRVSEEFVKYLRKNMPNSEQSGPEEEEAEEDNEGIFGPDAETIVSPLRDGYHGDGRSNSARMDSERWKMRYEMEKEKNKDLKNVTSDEIDRTASNITAKLAAHVPQMVPVCGDLKNKVSDCYYGYPNKPLTCYSEVQEYMQCVYKSRGEQLPS